MILLNLAIACLFIALVLALLSMTYYHSILAKIVVLEVIANMLMADIGLWSLFYKETVTLDVCLAIALIMFLGNVAYYRYLLHKDDVV